MTVYIYIDDLRPTPKGWLRCYRVREACLLIKQMYKYGHDIVISLDHDAGDYGPPDYIEVLNWLEEQEVLSQIDCSKMSFYLHTGNLVGRDNMRRVIKKHGWKLVEHAEDF